MLIKEVYELYGSWAEFSRKLGFGSSTYQKWLRNGFIPIKSQESIECRTKGLLKASPDHTIPQNDAM